MIVPKLIEKINEPLIVLSWDLEVVLMNSASSSLFSIDDQKDLLWLCEHNKIVCPAIFQDKDFKEILIAEKVIKIDMPFQSSQADWEVMYMGDENYPVFITLYQIKPETDCLLDKEEVEFIINSIVNVFPGNYWWKDLSGRYMGCNDNVSKTLQLPSPKFVIGKTDYELPWADAADKLRNHDEMVMATRCSSTFTENILSLGGEVLTFLVVKSPLFNSKNQLIGTIGSSIDITELKKAQVELELSRTREAHFKAMSAIGGMLAHELRTPLSGIAINA